MHYLQSILISVLTFQTLYADADFSQWLSELRKDASSQGIQEKTFDGALPLLQLNERVNQLEKKQPEFTQTLSGYLEQRITSQRIATARTLLADNKSLLDSISATYGVNPRIIVALWGMESNFGRYMGSFSVLSSLTTLAYSSRRGDYFRRELLAALETVQAGHAQPEEMLGSWAGAMGQCQFMPWNYKQYAVDFDGDGRRDIWHNTADALASIANFLRALGWNERVTWGRPVLLPPHFDTSLTNGKTAKTLAQWNAMGVRRLNNQELPTNPIQARLLIPNRSGGRAYLIYDNFDAIMKWNRSHFFAIATGTLSDQLRE